MATQGQQANAKDDTLYYAVDGGGGFADLATDLSQHAANQTNGGTWTYEASPATRFNVTSRWTIEARCSMSSSTTGWFFSYGSSSNRIVLALSGTGILRAQFNATVLGSLTLPGIGAGAEQFVVAWATEPNPATTSSSNALRSELRAWNLSDGTYAQSVFTHADRASSTSAATCWASSTGGANNFSGTAIAIRISAGRFRTASETRQDFVGSYGAPTITSAARVEFPIVDPACELGAAGQLAGPVLAHGAASVRSMQLRTLGPIVNEVFPNRTLFVGSATLGGFTATQYALPDPIDADYTLLGIFLFYRPVPRFVDRLRVRVHAQQYRVFGATADRLHFRLYSMSRPHSPTRDVVDQNQDVRVRWTEGTIAADHGSGAAAGEWVDCGLTEIARNSADCTWLALAVRVEDLSGSPDNTRFVVGAVTVEPCVLE